MQKTLIHQDKDNKHYQIKGATDIFYHHHLGRHQGKERNPNWERVTICVYKKLTEKDDCYITLGRYQFDGVGCIEQANQKLFQLIN